MKKKSDLALFFKEIWNISENVSFQVNGGEAKNQNSLLQELKKIVVKSFIIQCQ